MICVLIVMICFKEILMQKIITTHDKEKVTVKCTEDGILLYSISKTMKQAAIEQLGYKFNGYSFNRKAPSNLKNQAIAAVKEYFYTIFTTEQVNVFYKNNSKNIAETIRKNGYSKEIQKLQSSKVSGKSTFSVFDEIEAYGVFKIQFDGNGGIKVTSERKITPLNTKKLEKINTSLEKLNLINGLHIKLTLENYNILTSISKSMSKNKIIKD